MADTKISAATDISSLNSSDKLPIARVASTTAYYATITELITYVNGTLVSPPAIGGTTPAAGHFSTLSCTSGDVVGLEEALTFFLAGKPATAGHFHYSVPFACTVPASLAGTTVYDGTTATGSAVFTVNKITTGNTITALGTVTITTTNHFSATLAGAGGSLAAGDVVQIVCPTQDATLADLAISILVTRT